MTMVQHWASALLWLQCLGHKRSQLHEGLPLRVRAIKSLPCPDPTRDCTPVRCRLASPALESVMRALACHHPHPGLSWYLGTHELRGCPGSQSQS